MSSLEQFHSHLNELGFTEEETHERCATLDRVTRHIEVPYLVVGGLANRILFPQWARQVGPLQSDGIDLVLQSQDGRQRMVNPEIQKDFYVMHLMPEYGAHSIDLVDRQNGLDVDLFVQERPLRFQIISFRGRTLRVPTAEEIFLKSTRDVYRFLIDKRPLERKHVQLFQHLRASPLLNRRALESLWPREAQLFGTTFETLDDYIRVTTTLAEDPEASIIDHHPRSRTYPQHSPTVHGLAVVDAVEWEAAPRLRDQVGGQHA